MGAAGGAALGYGLVGIARTIRDCIRLARRPQGTPGEGGNLYDETVKQILKRKRASIMDAPLEPGSKSWDQIMDMTWREIVEAARRREIGFDTFRKLLSDSRFNR